ncbi:hypothetical protein [Haliangium sp.]|uniref:hypothetical protein n=1 Tax=Haliangium sp. TaxID=2663208 RepID=UPI003D14D96B
MTLAEIVQTLANTFAQATPAGRLQTAGGTNLQRPMAPQDVLWYAADGAIVENVIKLPVGADADPAQRDQAEASSLRIHRYGPKSPTLQAALDQLLTATDTGDPSPYRRTYRLGQTSVTPAPETSSKPGASLDPAKFERLRKVVCEPGRDFDDVTKAIELLAQERSERVIEIFLASGSLYALDLLSQWGIERAAAPLDELLQQLSGDRMRERVLVARRRLDAWAIARG